MNRSTLKSRASGDEAAADTGSRPPAAVAAAAVSAVSGVRRRLVMEGDTELGLLVKNTPDALEFSLSPRAPRDMLRLLRSRMT